MRENLRTLFEARKQRPRPATDKKILTSWNALLITGLVDSYEATGEHAYLDSAVQISDFFRDYMFSAPLLKRNYNGEKAEIPGFLDDYAFYANALIRLYQVTFDEKWITTAYSLIEGTIQKFYDERSGMFFYSENSVVSPLERKMAFTDTVMPSSNAIMANNLLMAGKLYYNQKWITIAEQMVANIVPYLKKNPVFYSTWAVNYLHVLNPPYEIAITGKQPQNVIKQIMGRFLPDYVAAGSSEKSHIPILADKEIPRDGNTIYPCKGKVCEWPLEDYSQLEAKLKEL